MRKALAQAEFRFHPDQGVYHGKVRDVYTIGDKVVMVASDRISAFDYILPRAIPYKGQVLNLIAKHFLDASSKIVPNWLEAIPHPNVAVGKNCEPIRIEMVIRGYLAGHAWRTYNSGERELCGVQMPEGMREADRFPEPIITPATKAEEGHDEDISESEILKRGIVTQEIWNQLKGYTKALFALGTEMAAGQGLILVDTKYEFGIYNGDVILIDEIHTPDSSRYYHLDGYGERQRIGESQIQLSKEFVREWLMAHGFQGLEGQVMPEMPQDFVDEITKRYVDLYEKITGSSFVFGSTQSLEDDIQDAVVDYLSS
jgi:phosphoribosylaminoimidazole-succinocarboxamide synthase